jgi:hypothetical protein
MPGVHVYDCFLSARTVECELDERNILIEGLLLRRAAGEAAVSSDKGSNTRQHAKRETTQGTDCGNADRAPIAPAEQRPRALSLVYIRIRRLRVFLA